MKTEASDTALERLLQSSLGFLVNALARLMRTELENRLRPLDITPTNWVVLIALGEEDCLSQVDLARRVYLDAATMTRALEVLEVRGLIRRTRDGSDRRVQIVELTERGRETVEEIAVVGATVNDEMTSPLSVVERLQVEDIIRRLIQFQQASSKGDGNGA